MIQFCLMCQYLVIMGRKYEEEHNIQRLSAIDIAESTYIQKYHLPVLPFLAQNKGTFLPF